MFKFVVDGWPLLPVVMGLVELIKKLFPDLAGRATMAVTFVLGVVLGCGYLLTGAIPTTPQEWFVLVVGCLIYGLVPLGLYGVATKSYQLQKTAQADLEAKSISPSWQPK